MTQRINDQFKQYIISIVKTKFTSKKFRPFIFFLNNGIGVLHEVPIQNFKTREGKEQIAQSIKAICRVPTVTLAGIAMEAYVADMVLDTDEAREAMKTGKVSTIPGRKDSLVILFSSPEGEVCQGWEVNDKTFRIIAPLEMGLLKSLQGIFSHFFTWNVN